MKRLSQWIRSRGGWALIAAALVAMAVPRLRTVLYGNTAGRSEHRSFLVLTGLTRGQPLLPAPAPPERSKLAPAFFKPVPTSVAELKAMQQHVESLVAQVAPAVVAVEVGTGSGSGVVISEDGLVLTAGHVCGDPNRDVRFTFPDGKTVSGTTLGSDEDSDTGLMQITDHGKWPHASLGDLALATPGDWVLALGHPGGFDLRRSLVVRLGRVIRVAPDVLQTDCTIAPGDSGGPLFDMQGRVVGIHTAIRRSLTENYHVPITAFYDTWAELVRHEVINPSPQVAWADFGATAQDDPYGCQLNAIQPNGPAAKAGLKQGDVILQVEGRSLSRAAFFHQWIAEAHPGDVLHLQVKRGNQVLDFNVTLGAAPHGN